MNTPPYTDSAMSPRMHLLTLSPHSQAHNMLPPPANSALAGVDGDDVRQLYTSSWHALDAQPPPTIREILAAYRAKGEGDRDMLLAMLQAKSAEDQRLASQAALRRTMLEITQAAESEPMPNLPLMRPQHSPHGHGQIVAAQGISPRLPHSSYTTTTSSHQAFANGHHYTFTPRDTTLHRVDRSPDVDVDSQHHRRRSYPDPAQALENHAQGRSHGQSSSHSSPRGRDAPQPQYHLQHEKDRRKRFKRSPSPQPHTQSSAQVARVRGAASVSSSVPSGSGSGTLRLRDSPPPNRAHSFVGPDGQHSRLGHPFAQAEASRLYSDSRVPAGSRLGSYLNRNAKREVDELEDDVEMETGSRGSNAKLGKVAHASYSAVRAQTARSLSPLEDDEVAPANHRVNGSARSLSPRNVQSRDLGEDKGRTMRITPPQSTGSTPTAHAQKADGDRERWEAVLSGKRDRSSAPGSHTRSPPNQNMQEAEPAR